MNIAVLLEAALRSLLMGSIVFSVLQLLRIDQVRARRAAWLLALAGSLAMPLFISAQIGPRVLPQLATAGAAQPARAPAAQRIDTTPIRAIGQPVMAVFETDGSRPVALVTKVGSIAMVGYGIIAGGLLLRLWLGVGMALRLRNQAQRTVFGFDPLLDVRISSRIFTPVTIASSVLLPESHTSWDEPTLRIVLAHERAHVRQADFYVHLLAGLHCAVFWFNPFSWWLRRQLSELGEALSDRAAVEQAENRASYAEILLAFATRAPWPRAGVAMAAAGNLTPRIERLLSDRSFERSFSVRKRWPLVAVGVVMLAMIASTSMARMSIESHTTGTISESTTDATNGTSNDVDVQNSGAGSHDEGVLAIRAGHAYITIDSGNHLPEQAGDYVYYQHHGKPYLVQDPSIMAHVQALMAPMEELARKERELGNRQAILGAQQRLLSEQQRAVKLQIDSPAFKSRLAQIENEMKQMDVAQAAVKIDQQALANLQSHLGEIQALVGELQSELGMQEGALGEKQGALGEQQGVLGEQQALLGEQRRKIIEDVRHQLQPLIEKAIREGKGKPLSKENVLNHPYA